MMFFMKLKILVLVFCFGLLGTISAQPSDYKALSSTEKTKVVNAIAAASKNLSSLQLNFVQTKKVSILKDPVKSQGKMYYQSPMMLRWEYTQPKQPAFVMNNTKVALVAENGTKTTPNRGFQEMNTMVMKIMNGDELANGKNFTVTCYANSNNYWLKMVPVNKRLKQMFSSFNIMVDKKTKMAKLIKIEEVSGDVTMLEFSNVITNKTLDKKLFAL